MIHSVRAVYPLKNAHLRSVRPKLRVDPSKKVCLGETRVDRAGRICRARRSRCANTASLSSRSDRRKPIRHRPVCPVSSTALPRRKGRSAGRAHVLEAEEAHYARERVSPLRHSVLTISATCDAAHVVPALQRYGRDPAQHLSAASTQHNRVTPRARRARLTAAACVRRAPCEDDRRFDPARGLAPALCRTFRVARTLYGRGRDDVSRRRARSQATQQP